MMMIWEGYNLSKGVNKNTYLILSELNCALVGWLDRREKEGGGKAKGESVWRIAGEYMRWVGCRGPFPSGSGTRCDTRSHFNPTTYPVPASPACQRGGKKN